MEREGSVPSGFWSASQKRREAHIAFQTLELTPIAGSGPDALAFIGPGPGSHQLRKWLVCIWGHTVRFGPLPPSTCGLIHHRWNLNDAPFVLCLRRMSMREPQSSRTMMRRLLGCADRAPLDLVGCRGAELLGPNATAGAQ